MDNNDPLDLAYDLFNEAYQCQMVGEFETAIELYRRSIHAFPTAEAHTFLGWTYSFQGRLDEAIAECKKAIRIDPEFGNPYNDIGAYLLEKSQPKEAIPWLKRAARSRRYDNNHYAHYNLGRAYADLEQFAWALEHFNEALRIRSGYELAQKALIAVRKKIN